MKITLVDFGTVSYGDIDISPLEELGDVTVYGALSENEIISKARDSEILIVNKAEVTRCVAENCKKLKYVGTFSTGYNNVDAEACRECGITVCNAPDYSSDAVCQHAIALMLCFAGRTYKYIDSVAAGDWVKSPMFCYAPWRMTEVCGKTMGIYGYGSIGGRVAAVAAALGMKVIVHSRRVHDDCPYPQVSAAELFAESDFISLHCPLNDETRLTIDAAAIASMKREAVIINTARGGLIDERALADALNDGRLGGACLDTLTQEPPKADNPLLNAKNCIITPHIAWAGPETRQRLVNIVIDNVRAFLSGAPVNKVN